MSNTDITTRLVIKSTPSQWRVILRVTDTATTTRLGDSVVASFTRRPMALFALYAAVTAMQKLFEHTLGGVLIIETNKDGLSELSAVGLLPVEE